MSDATVLLAQLRAHLVGLGLAREPQTAGAAHPLYLQPRDGAPAPGDKPGVERDTELVLTAMWTGEVGLPPRERFRRIDTVDVWLRGRTAPAALDYEAVLRAQLHDRRAWTMGTLPITESLLWRPAQPLGSDAGGYVFIVSYSFEYLTGLDVEG